VASEKYVSWTKTNAQHGLEKHFTLMLIWSRQFIWPLWCPQKVFSQIVVLFQVSRFWPF